jgi:hypothetical protein
MPALQAVTEPVVTKPVSSSSVGKTNPALFSAFAPKVKTLESVE